jgi:hypothetical protein
MTERLADADGAIVGRAVAFRQVRLRGQPTRVVTFDVDYAVKGEFGARVQVSGPLGTDCDLAPPEGEAVGVLVTRTPRGGWTSSECGIVSPSQLVAAGDEPKGGAIKIVIGVAILAAVLGWALVRRRRGARPELPGAPGP